MRSVDDLGTWSCKQDSAQAWPNHSRFQGQLQGQLQGRPTLLSQRFNIGPQEDAALQYFSSSGSGPYSSAPQKPQKHHSKQAQAQSKHPMPLAGKRVHQSRDLHQSETRPSAVASPSEAESSSKGAISQLQEFVQGAKVFPMQPNCPVLQWDYDTRMVGTSLEFRATVAFFLDGVAHHVVGAGWPSKKIAQRDCAERALGLFVNRWASMISTDWPLGATANVGTQLPETKSYVQRLEAYLQRGSYGDPASVQWSHRWRDGKCQAYTEVRLMDVPHTFPGKPMETQEAAYEDVARRVLWYLRCPGNEDDFEPDINYVKVAAQDIPSPHPFWIKDAAENEGEEQQLAERKTTMMRVQNRLQQAFARQLEAGVSVWYWSFERDPKDKGWPPLFRASVSVPLANRTFCGRTWQRGQRDAQIQTCALISQYLDEEFPKLRS
eukprot:TRINITY_DN11545_c0_g1_i1.p1 TRINITY_DN11545_c0_g1~~TRINITY_DN11545_c0_g1_i1.p1  ORF type:complete len:436 (-),score=71.68 TRINITY_DN11545_c0_g1_i1:153-1460(-)